jgi:hypothetical protein
MTRSSSASALRLSNQQSSASAQLYRQSAAGGSNCSEALPAA